MSVKKAEAKLVEAKQSLSRERSQLSRHQLELAAVRSKMDAPRATLERVGAMTKVTTGDLVEQSNAERELAQLRSEEARVQDAVTASEATVLDAEQAVTAAEQSVPVARFYERQSRLMARVVEVNAELTREVDALLIEARDLGERDDLTVGLLTADRLSPSQPKLVALGEALAMRQEYARYDSQLARMNAEAEYQAGVKSRRLAKAAEAHDGRITLVTRFTPRKAS